MQDEEIKCSIPDMNIDNIITKLSAKFTINFKLNHV